MSDPSTTTIIVALLGTGATVLTSVLGYFAGLKKSRTELETKQIESSSESERKQLIDRGHFENRLIGRIESLEQKLDEQHRQCREELLAAMHAAERECETKMIQREKILRRDIDRRLNHHLEELSEPE
jgi:protein subunit release factor B